MRADRRRYRPRFGRRRPTTCGRVSFRPITLRSSHEPSIGWNSPRCQQLYFRLCDPILIDGGKMGFFVDRETGVKCFILSARELGIAWGDTPQYWNWIHHPESRFPVVAELRRVCWLEIHGRINCRILSKQSYYSAYLIFKVSDSAMGLTNPPQEASVTIGTHVSKSPVRLMEPEDSSRFRPITRRPGFPRNPAWVSEKPVAACEFAGRAAGRFSGASERTTGAAARGFAGTGTGGRASGRSPAKPA